MAAMLARVRRASSACASSAAAAARRPSTCAAIVARGARTATSRRCSQWPVDASRSAVPRVSSRDARDHAAPGSAAAARRRARQLAGLAQGEAPAARRRLRGDPRRRARAGGVRRARARRLRRAHRARRRSRADVEGRQAALDERRDADHDRLHRSATSSRRRSSTSPAARSSTPSTWRTAASASTRWCRSRRSTARRSSRSRSTRSGWRRRASASSRSRATIYDIVVGEYGLAPEDLIYDALTFTLATGDAEWIDSREGDDRGHPPDQARAAGRVHDPRRVERELRARTRGARRAQLGVPAPLRRRRGSTRRSSIRRTSRRTPRSRAEERALADDLVFNRRPDALQRFIEHFRASEADAERRREKEDPTAGHDAGRSASTGWFCTARRKGSRTRSTPRACARIRCAC